MNVNAGSTIFRLTKVEREFLKYKSKGGALIDGLRNIMLASEYEEFKKKYEQESEAIIITRSVVVNMANYYTYSLLKNGIPLQSILIENSKLNFEVELSYDQAAEWTNLLANFFSISENEIRPIEVKDSTTEKILWSSHWK